MGADGFLTMLLFILLLAFIMLWGVGYVFLEKNRKRFIAFSKFIWTSYCVICLIAFINNLALTESVVYSSLIHNIKASNSNIKDVKLHVFMGFPSDFNIVNIRVQEDTVLDDVMLSEIKNIVDSNININNKRFNMWYHLRLLTGSSYRGSIYERDLYVNIYNVSHSLQTTRENNKWGDLIVVR